MYGLRSLVLAGRAGKNLANIALAVAVLILVVVGPGATGCGLSGDYAETEYFLDVAVTKQPAGGSRVATLSTTYKVTYRVGEVTGPDKSKPRPPEPVTLTVAYVNDQGGRYNEEQKTFSPENTGGTYTINFSSRQPGMFLDKTFWVVFQWSDYGGKHVAESARAVCTVPK